MYKAEMSGETLADFSESLKFYNKLKKKIQKCSCEVLIGDEKTMKTKSRIS